LYGFQKGESQKKPQPPPQLPFFPRQVFWRLFREDGALAELSRNFLLATRCLHAFGLQATPPPVRKASFFFRQG